MNLGDDFSRAITIYLTAMIGAGIFALPVLSQYLGATSIIVLLLVAVTSYLASIAILKSSKVDPMLNHIYKKLNVFVVLFALVSYIYGLYLTSRAPWHFLFLLAIVPMILDVKISHGTNVFMTLLTVLFISTISLVVMYEHPEATLNTSFYFSKEHLKLLVLTAFFAFYAHNTIQSLLKMNLGREKLSEVLTISTVMALLLYVLFIFTTANVSGDNLSILGIASISRPFTRIAILLFTSIFFYTSFAFLSTHFSKEIYAVGKVPFITAVFILYALLVHYNIPFYFVTAAGGLFTMLSLLFALLSRREKTAVAYTTIALILLFLGSLFI